MLSQFSGEPSIKKIIDIFFRLKEVVKSVKKML